MQRLEGWDILCLSVTLWGRDTRSRYRHLMERFAERNRVLYVEPAVSIPYALLIPDYRASLFKWLRKPLRVSHNTYLYAFPPSLPFKGMARGMNRLCSLWTRGHLAKGMRAVGFRNDLTFVVSPYDLDLLPALHPRCLCYDCADDHTEVKWRSRGLIRRMEREVVGRADLVFASSDRLWERLRGLTDRVYRIPNGADCRHFATARQEGPWPKELIGIRPPVVGFVGCFRDGVMDFDLLDSIAGRIRGTLLLIGPNQLIRDRSAFSRLLQREGVQWLGFRPYESLPRYLKAMDVCLIPYRVTTYMLSVFPLKLMEYLAAGKPVVSVDIPEVRPFEGLVSVARSREEFLRGIEEALQGDDGAMRERRMEAARKNDWETRAQAMEEVILNWVREQGQE